MKTLKILLSSLAFVIGIGASFAFNASAAEAFYNSRKPLKGGGGCQANAGTAPESCCSTNTGDACVIAIEGKDYHIYATAVCTGILRDEF